MKKPVDKWRIFGAKVYRLSAVFKNPAAALAHARELGLARCRLWKTECGTWAVYSRPPMREYVCGLEYYRAA